MGLSEYCFPGSCMLDEGFLTQTVLIEYTAQSFMFGEYFLFKIGFPIKTDYNEVYIPTQLCLSLDLMFSGEEEMPTDHTHFEKVSTRNVLLTIDWRKGLHDHWPVLFDYFHMAATGVTVHASLFNISPETYRSPSTVLTDKKVQTNRSVWPFQSMPSSTTQTSYSELLFGEHSTLLTSKGAEGNYVVPTKLIARAKQVHKMFTDVIIQARDSLRTRFIQMSGQVNGSIPLAAGPSDDMTTLEEVQEECQVHLEALGVQLQATWEWFCQSVLVHPDMMSHLSSESHLRRLELFRKTFIDMSSREVECSSTNCLSLQYVESVAGSARKQLASLPQIYCMENLENSTNACAILVEPCPWQARYPVVLDPGNIQRFQTQLTPYLSNKFPSRHRRYHPHQIHLVICVHGLQGNQFDLRLYRTYLELALPYHKLEFLMAQANQYDTFIDFIIQTNRLEEEVLAKLHSMTTPPVRISFLAHSLGGIVVRSLITRPSMVPFLPKLHLFLSICGPHLGTQHQTGMVSAGMWFVRKWYSSISLLQLSLKDAPNPRDSFLYHLSEANTFDCFKYVVLLTSLQDKYVPHQSARMCPYEEDNSTIGKMSEEMARNITTQMEERGVSMVRVIVQHALSTTTDSLIGRAAHVAMLDNEHFVEKFVVCHLAQYFLET